MTSVRFDRVNSAIWSTKADSAGVSTGWILAILRFPPFLLLFYSTSALFNRAKLSYALFPSRPDRGCQTTHARLRGVFENARYLGPPSPVYDLRPRGLLRFFKEQTCNQTFPRDQTSHHEVDRTGRRLGVV